MRIHGEPLTEAPDVLLAALERTSDAVVVADSHLCVSHFNAAAELIWQLDRAQVLGHHVSCLGVKELARSDAAQTESVEAGDAAAGEHGYEITIQRKDGSRIRAMLSVSRVDAGGQSRTVAVLRDITEEAELREKLALVSLIADGTNRAVVVTDYKLRIVYTNAAFSSMFGHSLEEAKGRQAYELLVGRHTDRRALARLRRLIDEKRSGEEKILSYDKNGDEVWLSANLRAFHDDRGRVRYICALLTDITETRQLRSLQRSS